MEKMEKSPATILNEAATMLEEETVFTWGQGNYFRVPDAGTAPGCIVCAHGAIAYCGNPDVASRVDRFGIDATSIAVMLDASSRVFGVVAGAANRNAAAAVEAYAGSVISIKDYLHKHYGGTQVQAHYLAGKVGLTFDFNDAPGRTKEEVIAKLREAAI